MKPSKSSSGTTAPAAKRSKPEKPSAERSSGKKRSNPRQGSFPSTPPGPVLGLDLSLTGCGLVVLEETTILRKRRYKTAPLPEPDGLKLRPAGQRAQDRFLGTDEERIEWLGERVVLALKKFKPALVVIEGHAFGARGRGKTVLAELHGVIKNKLMKREIPFVVKPPSAIKKHVTGDGKAQKIDVIYAAKKAGHKISDSDTADAWACARYGWDKWAELVEEVSR